MQLIYINAAAARFANKNFMPEYFTSRCDRLCEIVCMIAFWQGRSELSHLTESSALTIVGGGHQ